MSEGVTMDGATMPRVEKFRYLGSIIEYKEDIDEDISQCIGVGWQKWRNASSLLCDKKILVGLEGRVYHVVIRPTLLYGSECWPIKKTQVLRLIIAEMKWSDGCVAIWDWIESGMKWLERKGVAPIQNKMRETRLRWLGHVKKRSENKLVRRCGTINLLECRKGKGRPKKSWNDVIKYNPKIIGLIEAMT